MSSSTIDISQISEYLTAKHIGLLVAIIIVISLVFGKKRPKNAPPTAHVGLPVIGIVMITITIIYKIIITIIITTTIITIR